jgi:regulatory protein YycH of two-component signal transduction system YycFG
MEFPQLSKYGHLVDDIKKVLIFLRSFKVTHIKMTKNKAVHSLTKEVVTHIIDLIWLEDIPSIIYAIVCRECSIPLY